MKEVFHDRFDFKMFSTVKILLWHFKLHYPNLGSLFEKYIPSGLFVQYSLTSSSKCDKNNNKVNKMSYNQWDKIIMNSINLHQQIKTHDYLLIFCTTKIPLVVQSAQTQKWSCNNSWFVFFLAFLWNQFRDKFNWQFITQL